MTTSFHHLLLLRHWSASFHLLPSDQWEGSFVPSNASNLLIEWKTIISRQFSMEGQESLKYTPWRTLTIDIISRFTPSTSASTTYFQSSHKAYGRPVQVQTLLETATGCRNCLWATRYPLRNYQGWLRPNATYLGRACCACRWLK